MKKRLIILLWLGMVIAVFIIVTSFGTLPPNPTSPSSTPVTENELKQAAFEILKSKCNSCHQKRYPFMVFNERNMTRRAPKIHKMVFVERSMPKGNEIRLTNDESQLLKKWLLTQIAF